MNRIFKFDMDRINPCELSKIMAAISKKFPNDNIVAIPNALENMNCDLGYLKSVAKFVNERIAELEAKEKEERNG